MIAAQSAPTWIAQTDDALRLARSATDAQSEIDRLESARDELTRLALELTKSIEALRVLKRVANPTGSLPPAEVSANLQASLKSLGQRPIEHLIRALERYWPAVQKDLIQQWGEYTESRLGSVDELGYLASALRGVDDVAEQADVLSRVLGELGRMQRQLPSSNSLDVLENATAQLSAIESALQPAEVREFLTSVARGGASVELLTPDVVGWIRAHNAMRNFRVTAGEAGGSNA